MTRGTVRAAVTALLAWQLWQAQEAEAAAEAWQTQGHAVPMDDPEPSIRARDAVFQRLPE